MVYVVIDWVDIYKETNADDFNYEVSLKSRFSKMRTVGNLLQENSDGIILVQEYNSDGSPRDWVVIPKSLIKKIVKLKED